MNRGDAMMEADWEWDEAVDEVEPAYSEPQPEPQPEPQATAPIQRARSVERGRYSDVSIEQQIVGWMLERPSEVDRVTTLLTGEEFRDPLLGSIFGAIFDRRSRGEATDPASLATEFAFADLIDLQALVEIVSPEPLVNELVELAKRRKVARSCTDALRLLDEAGVGMVADDAIEQVLLGFESASTMGGSIESTAVSWNELSLRDEAEPEWLIDGLIRVGHRLILVGGEGSGKSTILRQIAFAASLGLHPFHRRPLKRGPVRTLVVDLENPRDQVSGLAGWLVRAASKTDRQSRVSVPDAPGLVVEWPGGINIRRRPDRARLEAEIRAARPELLVIGPLYQMYQPDSGQSDEDAAREVCAILDDWRKRFGMAMLFEHHAPHGGPSGRKMRPVGSSFWLRWPEYGITIRRDKDRAERYNVGRFRGDRMPVNWPTALDRRESEHWPVTGFWAHGNVGEDDPRMGAR